MSGALQKVEGVESVEVSLNAGVARIRLKPQNRVSLEKLRKIVTDHGFTPRSARVELTGEVLQQGDSWQLAVFRFPETRGRLCPGGEGWKAGGL